jgi:hypothetical protein
MLHCVGQESLIQETWYYWLQSGGNLKSKGSYIIQGCLRRPTWLAHGSPQHNTLISIIYNVSNCVKSAVLPRHVTVSEGRIKLGHDFRVAALDVLMVCVGLKSEWNFSGAMRVQPWRVPWHTACEGSCSQWATLKQNAHVFYFLAHHIPTYVRQRRR